MSNLKECPFCNGIAKIHSRCNEEETDNKIMYFVRCTSCGCESAWAYRKETVEKIWNKRGGRNER